MADNITVDNGTLTDYVVSADDVGGGALAQRVKLAYSADGVATHVLADDRGLMVQGATDTLVTGNITAAQPSINTPIANATVASTVPNGSRSWTIWVSPTGISGSSVVSFDGSIDGGTTWFPIPGVPRQTINPIQALNVSSAFISIGVNPHSGTCAGLTNVRARANAYQAGDTIAIRLVFSPMGDFPTNITYTTTQGAAGNGSAVSGAPLYLAGNDAGTVRALETKAKGVQGTYSLAVTQMKDAGRTPIHLWATGAASGATTVETMITLTRSPSAGGATGTGTSFTPTNGKIFHIQSLVFASRGHSTGTAQATTFTLRVNTGGAAVVGSAAWVSCRTATPAVALDWDRCQLNLGDGIEVTGNGTIQFGLSANAVFTTNAPTWDAVIIGYEY